MKTEDYKEVSTEYRSSRKAVSIFCGIGIAWGAAQFEIKRLSLGTLGDVNIEYESIPILISVISLYLMFRCTLEYMMQPKTVRRWSFAKTDYLLTLYLVRFTLTVLTASSIARSWEMVFYIAGAFLIGVVLFFTLSFAFVFIMMPIRVFIRRRSGKRSIASAAVEATYYSFALSAIIYLISICLAALYDFNPLVFLGKSYEEITSSQVLIFSGVSLFTVISFLLDGRFLAMVFATEPVTIERKYMENGKKIISIEPNPEHPEYEKYKDKIPIVAFEEVRV